MTSVLYQFHYALQTYFYSISMVHVSNGPFAITRLLQSDVH